MYKHKTDKDIRCPLEYGMEIFGGKWKTRIICVLARKDVLRYNELKKSLANITDTVLATTLKELLESQIIERVQYNEIPPRVEYSLTERGKSVIPILYNICMWSGGIAEETEEDIPICHSCNYSGVSSL